MYVGFLINRTSSANMKFLIFILFSFMINLSKASEESNTESDDDSDNDEYEDGIYFHII